MSKNNQTKETPVPCPVCCWRSPIWLDSAWHCSMCDITFPKAELIAAIIDDAYVFSEVTDETKKKIYKNAWSFLKNYQTCGDCEIYKGGPDSCQDCPTAIIQMIQMGQLPEAHFCENCEHFFHLHTFLCPHCNGPAKKISTLIKSQTE